MNSTIPRLGGILCLSALVAACEPSSLTDARDQIGRGGERVIEYVLPIVMDSAKVQDLVDTAETTLDTTAAGILAVRTDPDSFAVDVGERLVFENVAIDSFTANLVIPPGLNPGDTYPFNVRYDALAGDTILVDVDTVEVYSGTLSITTRNRLPANIDYTITLEGFVDQSGDTVTASGTVSDAPGDGSYVTDVVSIDLAGVTIVQADAMVVLDGTATIVSTPNPALGDAAVVQSGTVPTMAVQMLAGPLDPETTPELLLDVEEESDPIDSDDFDFGEFEQAMRESILNDATVALDIENTAEAPAVLYGFTLGLVRLDALGNVPRDPQGNPVYETDSQGQPILIPVTDPGDTTLSVARTSNKTVALPAASLATPLVHLVLDDEQAKLIAAGTVAVGDGAHSHIERSDSLAVVYFSSVSFDLTIADTGVQIDRNSVNDGLDVENEREADSLVARIISPVELSAALENRTPFGTEVDIAFIGDSLPDGTDIFAMPGAVIISTISVSRPTVDARGVVTQATHDTVVVQLNNEEIRELFNEYFTAQARIRLLPGTGGGGRGAIQASDAVLVNSRVNIQLRAGKAQ